MKMNQRFVAVLFTAIAVPVLLRAGQSIELASGKAPQHPQQPQVAVDTSGGIHVVWGLGDQIFYARSDDGGKSFSEPAALPQTISSMSLGMRRGPRIAAGDGFICITAIGSKFKGGDGDLVAFRSTDGGKTWQGPSVVN